MLEVEHGRPTCLDDTEECDMVGHINDDLSVTPEPQDVCQLLFLLCKLLWCISLINSFNFTVL